MPNKSLSFNVEGTATAQKWLDRKGERGHKLAMQDKALEFEKVRGASRMAEIGATADAAWNTLGQQRGRHP
ncbi:MAG TPA: hypothetical protein DDW41_02640 [Candidatus Andersenbacteria bacterium]|nr:hypothetical protein [Candidatus Andersenbacteria bacterium]